MIDHEAPLLTLKGISRRFPGVLALDHVDFDLFPAKSMRWWAKTAPANPR